MESPAEAIAFGRYLQAFRLERHIRLEQVAEETRIGISLLNAIECEDVGRLPPDVFTRGFLRAYAEVVGADGAEAVRRYDAHRTLLQSSSGGERETGQTSSDVRRRLFLSLGLLIALMAGSILGYQHWAPRQDDASDAPPLQTHPSKSQLASSPGARPPSEASRRTPMPAALSKHILTISVHEDSWIKVVVDQGIPAEHTLKAGKEIKLEAQNSFNLLIGNAGGVRLKLDDKPLPVLGRRGEIVNLNLP